MEEFSKSKSIDLNTKLRGKKKGKVTGNVKIE